MGGAPGSLSLATGLLLGMASSLHCAGMCGGIAASLCFAIEPQGGSSSRLRLLMISQVGRVATYMGLGGIAGSFGTLVYGVLPATSLHFALRAVAAVSIGWIGLATLGLVPAAVTLDRLVAPTLARFRLPAATFPGFGAAPILCGIAWGLMPCVMVWSALFSAMAAGSGLGGATTMLGFGIGTVPAVTVAALGIGRLRDYARVSRFRFAVGLSLVGVAVLTLTLPPRIFATLCLGRIT